MRITTKQITEKKRTHDKIVAVSAYDVPFAKIVDGECVDILLVGDSLGMVLYGDPSTREVSMKEMLRHTKAVSRVVKNALVVGDMPYGSYDDPQSALRNALLFIEAGADAVKLEGGLRIKAQVQALLDAEIAVMGHVGMTPQSAEELGGYRVQGRGEVERNKVLEDARMLDELGVFSMVLECIPTDLGKKITETIKCPTIGIGAGNATNGQVLVMHDLLGFKSEVSPRFVRKYVDMDSIAKKAIASYSADVRNGDYPNAEESYS